MGKRFFDVEAIVSVRVEVDDCVFASALTDDWRKFYYPFFTRQQVVEHIAMNMLNGNAARVDQIDGFGDMPPDAVKLHELDWDLTATAQPPSGPEEK